MNVELIAKVCHEANKSYCETIGDNTQVGWAEAPDWQRQSAIKGVEFCLSNPNAPASSNHDSWYKEKELAGWTYGLVKDPEAKTHPCMVSYEKLPIEQQRKDKLFKNIVDSLK